ncbi:unnamed protein product, partial [Ixodes pacificus]
ERETDDVFLSVQIEGWYTKHITTHTQWNPPRNNKGPRDVKETKKEGKKKEQRQAENNFDPTFRAAAKALSSSPSAMSLDWQQCTGGEQQQAPSGLPLEIVCTHVYVGRRLNASSPPSREPASLGAALRFSRTGT